MVRRGGKLDWRCWILVLPGSPSRVVQMEVSMLSMYIFASYLSSIHLHTSMMTCLGFVIISWEIFFFRFSRDRDTLSRLLLGDVNGVSTSRYSGYS